MKDFIRLAGVLCLITLLAGLALAAVNAVTQPVIEENSAAIQQAAMMKALPGADGFSDLGDDIYKADNGAGYCVLTTGAGYGGAIRMMVGVDGDGVITGLEITELSETAGLGSKADAGVFKDQFRDKRGALNLVKNKAGGANDIVAISGATITSNAVISGVNRALKLLTDKGLIKTGGEE